MVFSYDSVDFPIDEFFAKALGTYGESQTIEGKDIQMKDESKIDEEKMARVIAEARKNPYWREVYDTAPSESCKRDIALSFYYSESCNEPFEINLADIKQERSRLEASYTIADWKHLSKHCGNNPLHSYYYGKVKELEERENGDKNE